MDCIAPDAHTYIPCDAVRPAVAWAANRETVSLGIVEARLSAGQELFTGYSQPPVKPARRKPATTGGQRRMMSQIRPVR